MNNMPDNNKFQTILSEMNRAGNFHHSLLTDDQGLTIVASTDGGVDPSVHSAITLLVQKAALLVSNQVHMANIDEISITDTNHRQLVCRTFDIHNQKVFLTILMPDKKQSYRQLSTGAIGRIRSEWSKLLT
ncbi:MAG: hypothetical protein HPY76_04940 [Anaerolineae bacterium]|jgi:predicted regulator of Ras-like GTPase activity (Roadblock/LC7/MglB family)|nr:hypothetical protein [Anaerolineae bacterium]